MDSAPEYIDVVDAGDRVVRSMLRADVHELELPHRGVFVLVSNDREFYLHERGAGLCCGMLAMVAEHVRAGETYAAAAARGLREEYGLEVELVPCFRAQYWPRVEKDGKLRRERGFGVFYRAFGAVDPDRTDRAEVRQLHTVTPEELEALVTLLPERFTPWAREVLAEHVGLVSAMWRELEVVEEYEFESEFKEPLYANGKRISLGQAAVMDGVPQRGLLVQV